MRSLRRRAVASLLLVAPAVGARLGAQAPPADTTLYETMRWRLVGPFRGGRSVAVAGVRGQPNVYWFGGVGGGVWKTTDAGITWENVTDGFLGTASVGAIAAAPSDANVVYAGMGEHAPRGVTTSHGDGVYRSTDAGRTWSHLGLEATRSISRIVVHPTDPDRVWVAAQGSPYGPTEERGVYRSTDGGASWEKVLFVSEDAGASDLSMDPTNPRILYAAFWDHTRHPWQMRSGGPGSGIWKSVDGGDRWERVGEGLPDLMGKVGVSVSGANPDRVYAIVEAEPDGGVFRSDDAGGSWTRVNRTRGLRSRPWYYMEIYADPADDNTVYVMNAPLWRSVDGGRTFQSIRQEHGDNHDLWINPDDPDNFVNANDGGAAITFNAGATWSTLRNQPTAQFYRVNADNRFPYRLYGGQQDNTSVAIKSRDGDGGIGWGDFHPSAGCESAWVAFDPDDPRYQYGGCYLGQIGEYDERTGIQRNVQVEPGLPASIQAKDMTYRFNWNAPIVVSPQDPRTIYHAGNVLLRTRDRGDSWEAISPDLTRNDITKQGPGGAPITNEGAGGEVYGTIFALAPSPVDAEVIWTGSDDGLVHLTRDGGRTWTNVTPEGLPEAQINAIDASPHEAGTAWVAVTRYKLGDFTPMAYRTTDFGDSWTEITGGMPEGHWVRVVREDTERPGLLYAGTEAGALVSFDAGERWQSLQLDLPVTPVTDLMVHRGDLLAATQGRAFWILDDLSPLRELAARGAEIAEAPVWLFRTGPAWRQGGGGFGGGDPTEGRNPPNGAVLQFRVADDPEGEARMEILDGAGAVVRTYTTDPGDGPNAPSELEVEAGMNRMVWDLQRERVPGVQGLYVFGSLAGGRVAPGTYTARLSVSGLDAVETSVVVRDVPDVAAEVTAANHRERDALLARIRAELTALHTAVGDMGDIGAQVDAVVERTKEVPEADRIEEAGSALTDSISAVDSMLVQRAWTTGQDPTVFPTRLNQFLIYLHGAVAETPGAPTQGMRQRFEALAREWGAYRERAEWILGPGVDGFNRLIEELGVPAVGTGRRAVS
jgi:photosystem II stability/assembly factor-like uncharacterized protein